MQRLQLRIAQQKCINISGLKGDEFKVLKDFVKLEERKELLNNLDDFFDPKYADQHSNQSSSILRKNFNNASHMSS